MKEPGLELSHNAAAARDDSTAKIQDTVARLFQQ